MGTTPLRYFFNSLDEFMHTHCITQGHSACHMQKQ